MPCFSKARATSKEEGWTPPAGVTIEYTPQAVASYKIDEQILLQMVEERKGDPREAQRLLRCAQPHAGGFVTAVPSKEDGNDAIMRPHLFRTAVQYRLGIPLLREAIPCPLCTQPIQPNGDHATCCANSGDRITRHNALRDMVAGIANQGLLSPSSRRKGCWVPPLGDVLAT